MFNRRELEMLNILWREQKPMTCSDIVAAKKGLTQNTAAAVINKLLEANLIKVHGTTYCGKVLGRTFVPTEESKDIVFDAFMEYCSWFKHILPISELIDRLQEP